MHAKIFKEKSSSTTHHWYIAKPKQSAMKSPNPLKSKENKIHPLVAKENIPPLLGITLPILLHGN